MDYTKKRFSVSAPMTDEYKSNYERIFRGSEAAGEQQSEYCEDVAVLVSDLLEWCDALRGADPARQRRAVLDIERVLEEARR